MGMGGTLMMDMGGEIDGGMIQDELGRRMKLQALGHNGGIGA